MVEWHGAKKGVLCALSYTSVKLSTQIVHLVTLKKF